MVCISEVLTFRLLVILQYVVTDWMIGNVQFVVCCLLHEENISSPIFAVNLYFLGIVFCFQCFDTVGWASGRTSGL